MALHLASQIALPLAVQVRLAVRLVVQIPSQKALNDWFTIGLLDSRKDSLVWDGHKENLKIVLHQFFTILGRPLNIFCQVDVITRGDRWQTDHCWVAN